ncbi:MAG: hypothetical protein LUF26_05790 [Firmicutes bacterium]|nr:hypothetical protein [Bacillota bacterium]
MKFDNLKEAIQFRINENKDEELFWISEVFEDIAERTQSKEFIKALRMRFEKVTHENYRQENFKSKLMRSDIDFDEFQRSVSEETENAEARID